MMLASGYVSVLIMALYLNSQTVTKLYSGPSALWGICLVLLYWTSWTAMVAHRGGMHDDPVVFALKDRTSQLCLLVAGFAVAGANLTRLVGRPASPKGCGAPEGKLHEALTERCRSGRTGRSRNALAAILFDPAASSIVLFPSDFQDRIGVVVTLNTVLSLAVRCQFWCQFSPPPKRSPLTNPDNGLFDNEPPTKLPNGPFSLIRGQSIWSKKIKAVDNPPARARPPANS